MRISKQTQHAIAQTPTSKLAKFKDEAGNRLHPTEIKEELTRRVQQKLATHPKVVKHRQRQASRVLGRKGK
jgi:hypothetical protein